MAQNAPKEFTKLVERRAKALGISFREIARRADLSVSFLLRILDGERGLPENDVLLRIAKALEVSPEKLLVEAGRVPPKPRLVKLMRAASDLTPQELEQVNKVAAKLLDKRKKQK